MKLWIFLTFFVASLQLGHGQQILAVDFTGNNETFILAVLANIDNQNVIKLFSCNTTWNWKQISLDHPKDTVPKVMYLNETFQIFYLNNSTSTTTSFVSKDGINFNAVQLNVALGSSLTFLNINEDKLVALEALNSSIVTSDDGVTWITHKLPISQFSGFYVSNHSVILASTDTPQVFYTSKNMRQWTTFGSDVFYKNYTNLYFCNPPESATGFETMFVLLQSDQHVDILGCPYPGAKKWGQTASFIGQFISNIVFAQEGLGFVLVEGYKGNNDTSIVGTDLGESFQLKAHVNVSSSTSLFPVESNLFVLNYQPTLELAQFTLGFPNRWTILKVPDLSF